MMIRGHFSLEFEFCGERYRANVEDGKTLIFQKDTDGCMTCSPAIPIPVGDLVFSTVRKLREYQRQNEE